MFGYGACRWHRHLDELLDRHYNPKRRYDYSLATRRTPMERDAVS